MKVKIRENIPFLTAADVKDGDVATIEDAGEYVSPEQSMFGREAYRFTIRHREKLFRWTMNNTTLNNLAKAYGDDTTNWVNKRVILSVQPVFVRGIKKLSIVGEPYE